MNQIMTLTKQNLMKIGQAVFELNSEIQIVLSFFILYIINVQYMSIKVIIKKIHQ